MGQCPDASFHLLIYFFIFQVAYGDLAVLNTRNADTTEDWKLHFCINFNPQFHDLPVQQDEAVSHPLVDMSSKLGCNDSDYRNKIVKDTVVLVARGNCTFTTKATLAQQFGSVGVLIASDVLLIPAAENETVDHNNINITVATILNEDVQRIQKHGSKLDVLLYAPVRNFDPNMVVIYLLAVTTVILGGFWSGITKHAKVQKPAQRKMRRRESADRSSETSEDHEDKKEDQDEEEMDISLKAILIFFILVCTFIVLLYFFYDYLVYVIIGLFVIAGASGMFSSLQPLWRKILPFSRRLPPNRVPCFSSRPELRSLLLLALCFTLGIFWAVERHASYAWVLQDIMGFFFCINALRVVCLPNLKICTVLLSLLFVYDVFFVFITPLFTKDGDSVMVSVATGENSKSGEQLPMVFKVPSLTTAPIGVCSSFLSPSLLGFGDVIVPGLLVAHNHAFDLKVESKRVYFIATSVAYAIGLALTYVALTLMKTGQPALLYLVPCTLITTFVIGCVRKEVKQLWNGARQNHKKDDSPTADVVEARENSSPVSSNSVNSVSSSDTDNESRELIRK